MDPDEVVIEGRVGERTFRVEGQWHELNDLVRIAHGKMLEARTRVACEHTWTPSGHVRYVGKDEKTLQRQRRCTRCQKREWIDDEK